MMGSVSSSEMAGTARLTRSASPGTGAHGGHAFEGTLEKHHMRAASAEQGGATWYGDGERPRSSIMWAPEALLVRCYGPIRRLASETQLIHTRKLKDHLPLGLEFDHVRLAGQPAPGGSERLGTLMPLWNG